MALAKDHHQVASRSLYESLLEVGSSSVQFPHISPYGFDDYHQQQVIVDGLESHNYIISNSRSPSLSSSSSASNYQPHEEVHSLISFKSNYGSFVDNNTNTNTNNNGSSFNFQLQEDHPLIDYRPYCPIWEGTSSTSINQNQLKTTTNSNSNNFHLLEEVGRVGAPTSSDYHQDASNDWLYAAAALDPPQETGSCFNKRPNKDEDHMRTSNKKQCTSKKPAKAKPSSTTKDPQSVAAKNRRERISERLKILQDLVPNGSKVDLVTMLEKAIGYVKFLQLQVKVLATDEFWPAAGGNAPDISQVREAIDAILLSQRSESTTK
ncbi:hypothetical protein vseg_005466 [Gypsophila vaccaria]